MNILLIVTGFPNKKTPANSVFNLVYAEELSKNNKVSIILLRSFHPFRPLVNKESFNGINLIGIRTLIPKIFFLRRTKPLYNVFKLFISNKKIKKVLQDVDIVHAIHRGAVDFSYIVSEKFNKPMISQFIGGGLKNELPFLLKRKYFVKGLLLSNSLCFNSKKLEKDFLSIVKENFNTRVLYRGVKLDDFPYNFSKSSVINILFLGGFPSNSNLKGGITLIETIKLLDSTILSNSIKFTIGGPSSLNFQKELNNLQNPNLKISFIGAVEKDIARRKMKESHIVIIPSLVEGLPNVLFESMASGNMVIATTVGGIPEILEDDVTGILIPPNDSNVLMNKIVKSTLNMNEIEKYAQNGRKKIESFNYNLFLNSYMSIYEKATRNEKLNHGTK